MTLTILGPVTTKGVADIDPTTVRVLPCARPVVEKAVLSLIDSFEQVGVLNKPMIRYGIVDGPTFTVEGSALPEDPATDATTLYPILVFGRHRMAAWGRLQPGTTMGMDIFDGTADEARKLEITENLHRCELNALQEAEQTAEWVRITGKEFAAARQEATDAVPTRGRPVGNANKKAAEALNKSISEVVSDIAIDKLSPQVKQAAIDAGLADRKSSLAKIAKIEKKEGVDAALAAVVSEAERIKLPYGQRGTVTEQSKANRGTRTKHNPAPAPEPAEEAEEPAVEQNEVLADLPWEEPVTEDGPADEPEVEPEVEPEPVNADGSVEANFEVGITPEPEQPVATPVAVKLLPLRADEQKWLDDMTALWNDYPSLRARGNFLRAQGLERIRE